MSRRSTRPIDRPERAPTEPGGAPLPAAPPRRRARVAGSLSDGVTTIKRAVERLPNAPGVYRMIDPRGDVLYVGKARSLKKRVAAYTVPNRLSSRIVRMISETATVEVVSTGTEVEALLLESNLIKRLMPRYNVLLRDDKSFPFILLAGDHEFPRLTKHRGARTRKGEYFGPFASAHSVVETITTLQRAFLLRNCSDSVFAARTRPCLQFQIKRCSAPCVGRVDALDYAAQIRQARDFLEGRSRQVQDEFARAMQAASDRLDFEAAATYRDRIRAMAHVQSRQDINVEGLGEADVIALHQEAGHTCIQVFFFRAGRNYGNRAYYPSHDRDVAPERVLSAFLGQFYDGRLPPPQILLSHEPSGRGLIEQALSVAADRRVRLLVPRRGRRRRPVDHAIGNAREALGRRLAESSTQRRLLEGMARAFGLEAPPRRIEVYDNSHIQGTNAVGAMIVAGPDGFIKNAYRKFNIRGSGKLASGGAAAEAAVAEVAAGELLAEATAEAAEEPAAVIPNAGAPARLRAGGDDYAMMNEVLTRRFTRALKEEAEGEGNEEDWPDVVLIDGGQGQLNATLKVFEELGIDRVVPIGIAKGPDRDAGRERFFMKDRPPISLDPKDPVLYFLQRLRDEAHRFAIGTHRARRAKAIGRSALDEIPGIGAQRKRALLHHFGSAKAVARAGLADLEAVAGISRAVAKIVHDHFRAGS
jgi:excinuclease ABC subunit C